MDPLSHGLLGAATAQACFGGRAGAFPRTAWLLGMASAMAPDLDVFVSTGDPINDLLVHRGFTHSLLFVPTGGFVCFIIALAFTAFRGFRGRRHALLALCMLAYATHPLLDACTSYGTMLFWPVSEARPAWDVVSVIDPIFTVPLLALVIWTAIARRASVAAAGVAWACLYLGLGFVQHERAESHQEALAGARGHAIERGRVMPTLGNMVLWRSLYEADGRLWADAVRVGVTGAEVREGSSVPKFDLLSLDTGDEELQLALARYANFTHGYTAFAPGRRDVIADMRYTRDPAGFDSIWGARVDTFTITPVALAFSRDNLWPDLLRRLHEVINGFEQPAAAPTYSQTP